MRISTKSDSGNYYKFGKAKAPKHLTKREVVNVLVHGFAEDESMLICPKCQYDYSHLITVFTRAGHRESEGSINKSIGYGGTEVIEVSNDERRDALVCVFEGECGHQWSLVIQQHKGNTNLFIEYDKDAVGHWDKKETTK